MQSATITQPASTSAYEPGLLAMPVSFSLSFVLAVVAIKQFFLADLIEKISEIQEKQATAIEQLSQTLALMQELIRDRNYD